LRAGEYANGHRNSLPDWLEADWRRGKLSSFPETTQPNRCTRVTAKAQPTHCGIISATTDVLN